MLFPLFKRVQDQIERHPDRFRIGIEEERDGSIQDQRDDQNRFDRNIWPGPDHADNECDREDEFSDDRIDRDGTGPVALFALKKKSTIRTTIYHLEPSAKDVSLATIRAAAEDSTPEYSQFVHCSKRRSRGIVGSNAGHPRT